MAFATVRDRYSEADIARFYAGGLWRPETFFEVAEQQAQRQPDKVFVADGTTSLTYRELRDSALALATGLHRMGITPGDRVAVQLPSWAEFNTFGCGSRLLAQAFGYSSRDIQFNPSPVTHTTGLITGFLLPLMHGASVHLMEAWEPRAGLADIAKFHPTVAVTATAFLQTLMDAYDPDQHDPSSMRLWVTAGSPIPAAFVRRAADVLPNLRVLSLYGRSENACTTTCTVDDDPERSVTSDGKALPGSSVQIVDHDGRELPRGEQGDIAYRGPMHMLEYISNPEETARQFTPDGYSRSGDLGVMDADG